METKWYVYRHTKASTSEVFYIGIGSSKNYKRAKTIYGRNNFWNKIFKKYGVEVDILSINNSLEEAREIEKILVSWYGRRDLNKGTLVNLTDGGEGSQNIFVSQETRNRQSSSRKGKVLSQETKDKIGNYQRGRKKPISFSIKMSKIHKGKIVSEDSKLKMSKSWMGILKPYKNINIYQYDKEGNIIKEWESISEACIRLGLSNSSISNNLKGLSKYCGGYKFKYKEKDGFENQGK